jgi:N-acetylmuramoyl-L-alanine amidase
MITSIFKKKKLLSTLVIATVILSTSTATTITTKAVTTTTTSAIPKAQITTLTSDESRTATVTWSAKRGAAGYEIQYKTKGKWDAKNTIVVKGTKVVNNNVSNNNVSNNNVSKKSIKVKSGVSSKNGIFSLNVKNLPKSKDVYFRIRSYRKKDGVTQYSYWSRTVRLVRWNSKWKYAKESKTHSGCAALFYAAPSSKRKNITVCINAGHGCVKGASIYTKCHPDGTPKVTGGSTASGSIRAVSVSGGTSLNNGISEASMNLTVAKKVKSKLLAEGYNVLMIRQESDVNLDNIARTVIANKLADCHIAIHFDSSSNGKGAFAITVPDISSYKNMEPVKSNWKKHNKLGAKVISGMKDKGVKVFGNGIMKLDLTQTSYSTIPSIDLEVADKSFSGKDKDVDLIAEGIVKGVEKYFAK